jgi:hypothetical protein
MAEPARSLPRLIPERNWERAVLILFIAILLASISVATFPCWPYSARWGHLPSTVAGVLLLCVAVAAVGGRSSSRVTDTVVEVASAPPPSSASNTFAGKAEAFGMTPESAFP